MPDPAEVTAYFEARARAMVGVAGGPHLRDACPLPVFTVAGTEVVASAARNRQRVRMVRAGFAALGVEEVAPDILSLDMPSCERMRVSLRVRHLDRFGPLGSASDLVYYLSRCNGLLRAEMIEVRHCPAYDLLRGWR